MFNLHDIRIRLEKSLEKSGFKLKFKHPQNGKFYNIYVEDGLINVFCHENGECKVMTWDGLLHLWLENPNYNE